MAENIKPPFRADQVGSLLRPAELAQGAGQVIRSDADSIQAGRLEDAQRIRQAGGAGDAGGHAVTFRVGCLALSGFVEVVGGLGGRFGGRFGAAQNGLDERHDFGIGGVAVSPILVAPTIGGSALEIGISRSLKASMISPG